MTIQPSEHVDAFRAEAERCAALARVIPHLTPVPHFRRWSAGGVLQHLTGDFRWAARIVREEAWDGKGFTVARNKGDALLRAFDEAAAGMAAALEHAAAHPHRACPNFADGGSGVLGWWPRHQAHETLLHRWDLESTTGHHQPIDPDVAADATDEAFRVYTERYSPQHLDRPLTIACTDAAMAWLITPGELTGRVTITTLPDADRPDFACTAEQLLLCVWKRSTPDQVPEAHGADDPAVRRFFKGKLTA